MTVTSTGVAVTLAIIVVLGFLFFGTNLFASFTTNPAAAAATSTMALPGATSTAMDNTALQALPTELTGKDEVVGTGATAEAGDTVTVNYVGALPDGTVFDASQNHGQPFSFQLGAGRVISGWDKGVVGMKEGGKRVLIIPPADGYGSQAMGSIPPNSTLIFEIELLKVSK